LIAARRRRVLRERGGRQRERQSQRKRWNALSQTFHFHFSSVKDYCRHQRKHTDA
jgi:hypothetical protein